MASGSYIGVTPGAGAKIATGPTYTENANVVQDQKVHLGEQYLASYTVRAVAVTAATANSHILQVMAGASLIVRVRKIVITQSQFASADLFAEVDIVRLSSAGTGGSAVTPAPLVAADGASGATAMTLPSAKGTETTFIDSLPVYLGAAEGNPPGPPYVFEFDGLRRESLLIPAGAANGIAVKLVTAVPVATLYVTAYITEAAF